ncbi:TlpA family protein disulfide reductase [Pedobacter metabolipauper]|uniref:Thiol-disulfide isomerase/thioredoxin n=1 Tax=Pedobacter metabolipauper TaxID=425513 RepID=A0A4R6STT9_9SPHI|nr:AhpC/TSA family protein [Pedobacter metabolipauper]TDQ08797.1 thiol-disulfide isomerase/thioredoxin [Pedobacter metabolipauper]
MRKYLAALWLFALVLVLAGFFWFNQLRYLLPTPVPVSYKEVLPGEKIKLSADLSTLNEKPLFLHFFNPDCPCSRFNMDHFKSLVKQYGGRLNFAVVLMSASPADPEEIRKRFDLDIPVFNDSNVLAKSCGVYSTPQAVVLEKGSKLYYRGNYNKSRYCTDEATSYAKIAVENLIHRQQNVKFNVLALQAYGCTLPNCIN